MDESLYISVNPAAVRVMKPESIPAAISLQRGLHGDEEPCFSVAIAGPAVMLYDPAHRLPSGRSLYLISRSGVAVQPISLEMAAAQVEALEAEGRPTYVHANSHVARANIARTERLHPVIAVRQGRYGKPQYAFQVNISGPSWLVACPARALPCSAKVYLVVPPGVTVTPLNAVDMQPIVDEIREELSDGGEYFVQESLF